MTKLIYDPSSLAIDFPDACDSKVYRVRIIAQVVEYIERESAMVLRRVLRFPTKNSSNTNTNSTSTSTSTIDGLKVSIIDAMPINHELTYSGAIINAEAFYDGVTVNVFHCFPINGQSIIPDDNVDVLTELNGMTSLV